MSNITNNKNPDPHDLNTTPHFGRSVESQAQMASTVVQSEPGEPLNIYRLEPIAAPDDPRWQGGASDITVVVAARTTGDARIVAVSSELDFKEIDAVPAEDVTTDFASMFRDEKLYTVIELDRGRTDVIRGVLDGTTIVDNIAPTQR
jgi:hypothetical protein